MRTETVSIWDVLNRCLEQGIITVEESLAVRVSGNPKKELEDILLDKNQ